MYLWRLEWLCSLVVRVLDTQLNGCKVDSRPLQVVDNYAPLSVKAGTLRGTLASYCGLAA